MAYDGSSLTGDFICEEFYDQENNLMNTSDGRGTDTGYYIYKIVGGGFDRIDDWISKFLNDCSVLSCQLVERKYYSTIGSLPSIASEGTEYIVTEDYTYFEVYKWDPTSLEYKLVKEYYDNSFMKDTILDKWWGYDLDLPRPLLYEGQKADYLFVDNGTTASHNDNWSGLQYMTRDDTGTTISNTGTGTLFEAVRMNNSNFGFENKDMVVEFEIVENPSSTNRFRFDGQNICTGGTYPQQDIIFSRNETGKFRFVYNSTNNTILKYKNGTYVSTYNHQFCGNMGLLFRLESGASIKIKDFKVYTGEDKERPLNDDEYRVYLYLKQCQLRTIEDLEVVFTRCFGNDEMPCFVETIPSGQLKLTDRLHNPNNSIGEDDLDFITDYLTNTEDVNRIIDKLHWNLNNIIVINIPQQNWDSNFLKLLEEFISIKSNILIQEYIL